MGMGWTGGWRDHGRRAGSSLVFGLSLLKGHGDGNSKAAGTTKMRIERRGDTYNMHTDTYILRSAWLWLFLS